MHGFNCMLLHPYSLLLNIFQPRISYKKQTPLIFIIQLLNLTSKATQLVLLKHQGRCLSNLTRTNPVLLRKCTYLVILHNYTCVIHKNAQSTNSCLIWWLYTYIFYYIISLKMNFNDYANLNCTANSQY